jgi:hypothetical protein
MTLPTETSLRDFHDLDTWPLVQTLTALVDSNAAVEAVRRLNCSGGNPSISLHLMPYLSSYGLLSQEVQ